MTVLVVGSVQTGIAAIKSGEAQATIFESRASGNPYCYIAVAREHAPAVVTKCGWGDASEHGTEPGVCMFYACDTAENATAKLRNIRV